MMPRVFSLIEAAHWFLNNSSGSLECVDGDRKKIVTSYPEAKQFYETAN